MSDTTVLSSSVADMLIQTNTLVASALSGREIVTTIFNRMNDLNQYLDPNYYESKLSVASQKQYILALYPEIKKYGESIHKLKTLVPVLDSTHLNNVPGLIPKLEQLTVSNLNMQEESQEVSARISEALQKYNDIIYSISRTFVQLEDILSRLESDMRNVLAVDENI